MPRQKFYTEVCRDLEIWRRNLVQGHSISLTYRNLLVISKKSAMTLTFKEETWFKVTAHLHLQALFLWSMSQIGQGKRKYGLIEKEFFTASKSCSSLDLHTLYLEALCGPHWVKGRENMPRTSDVRWKDWILMDVFKANYPYQLFKILTFSFRKVIQDTTWFRFAACCVKKNLA